MPLSAADIRAAFQVLSEELAREGQVAELMVVGGAALVLLFEARQTTKDVDAYFLRPDATEVRHAARRVAEVLDLPDDWLNDDAKGFMVALTPGETLFQSPSLTVRAASLQQLLAMKLGAWRDAIDRDDARLLLSKLSGDAAALWEMVEPLVRPPERDKAWYAFQDLWESLHGPE